MHWFFLIATISSATLLPARGFSPASSRISNNGNNINNNSYHKSVTSAMACRSKSTILYSTPDDRQSEITELEERLKELKQEEESKVQPDDLTSDELDAYNSLQDESEDSVMFSEKWKEAKDDYTTKQQENTMGGLAQIGGIIGVIVLLGLFSQVPVGEESLQRYQDIKGNPSRIDLGDLN